jgi:hypothetical protein
MTILIHVHQSHDRTFKASYLEHVQVHLASEFPHLVSYSRFVALIPRMMIPLLAYVQSRDASLHGHQFHRLDLDAASVIPNASVDTASLPRMLDGPCPAWAGSLAQKLHLATSDRGERLSCCLTAGKVDDRTPVPHLVKRLRGKLFGDRGSICAPLTQLLFEQGRASQHQAAQKHEESSHAPFR